MKSNDLVHLDLSYNWFTLEELEEIRTALLVN
jgi:hypothetical protein